ncbi:MAG: ATP-binding cassette domain-containing protein, partial [Candidatus Nanopelagicales bacterium]
MTTGSVLKFNSVSLVREQNQILSDVTFEMNFNDHLVIFGPNGAGKSSLVEIAAGFQFPTRGEVEILDQTMGRVDLSQLRLSIGYAGPRLSMMMEPAEKVIDAVLSAAWGVVGRWQETYSEYDMLRANQVIDLMGMKDFKDRAFGFLSDGE